MTDGIDPRLIEADYPFQAHLGFRVTAWRDGFTRIEMPMADHIFNRQGLPHGGIHATLMDSAMGLSGCYTGDPDLRRMAMTLSMTVNYMAVATGEILIAEGWRTGGGRRTFFAEARVTDGTGTVAATATGVFRYRNAD